MGIMVLVAMGTYFLPISGNETDHFCKVSSLAQMVLRSGTCLMQMPILRELATLLGTRWLKSWSLVHLGRRYSLRLLGWVRCLLAHLVSRD
jgi:hypothetical protein